ncbi:MAG: hypothetical protein RR540_02210 [Oscillospiraceae bacterium]
MAKTKKRSYKNAKTYIFVIAIFTISCIILTFSVYYFYTVVEKNNIYDTIDERLDLVLSEAETNKNEYKTFSNQVCDDSQSKAKALSIMIMLNPSILKDAEMMEETRMALGVEEINVSDENGTIISGTGAYNGELDEINPEFSAFYPAISDRAFAKTIQSIQNGENIFFTGVARIDKLGVVQITTKSPFLDAISLYSDITTVTNGKPILTDGCVAILDLNEYKYISHTNPALVGASVQIPKENFVARKGNFDSILYGEKAVVRYRHYGYDKIIMAIIPLREVYNSRDSAVGALIITQALLLVVVVLAVRQAIILKKKEIRKGGVADGN